MDDVDGKPHRDHEYFADSSASCANAGNRQRLPLVLSSAAAGGISHWITGIRVAWAFAWRALVAGELIAKGVGLGQMLQDGRGLGDTATILCVVIIIAVIGTISDHFCFKQLEDRIVLRFQLKK